MKDDDEEVFSSVKDVSNGSNDKTGLASNSRVEENQSNNGG